jgi:hypothetical protein
MSIKTVTLADKYLLDVAMAGDYIATYQLRSEFGRGDVLVLDAHTLAQVAAFTASDPGGTPVGFAMTDDGLVLQRQLSDGTCSSYVAELYGLAPEGPTLRADWRLVDACQSFGGNTPLHTVGLGHYAALEPTHQIVRIDPASGAMVPLRGPQQGSFERVLPAGENTVEVHGPTNAQLIDISQPDAPVVTVGGLYAPVHAELLQLELSERADPVLLAVPGTKTVGPVTSLLWGKKGELPAVTGSIANDDADHEWVASGNYLYQWAPQSTQDFRVRRFPLSSLMHANRQTLLPDIDQVLTTDPPAELSVRHQSFLRVDPRTGDLLITEPRSLPSDFGNSSYVLTWFSLSSGGYVRAFATPPATTSVVDVALFNGRILVVALDRASILARTGETTIRRDVDPTSIVLSAVLGFNERLVYLRSRFPGSPATTGVVVLRADDLSEVARYTTRETVFSAAEVNNKLAFGMRTAITVASPACP